MQLKKFIIFLLAASATVHLTAQAQSKRPSSKKQEVHLQADKELDSLKQGETSIWNCENKLQMKTATSKNGDVLLVWDKKLHTLKLKEALPGAQRFIEPNSKLELLIIPDKSMLFDSKIGQRLVDYCKTQEMSQGGKPPVYNNPQ